jgi:hypothetical protein
MSVAILVIFLITLIYCILAGAEAGMLLNNNASQCALEFPRWFGCAIANHENLAGGLIGASGTIVAGWIAWIAVQSQIAADREIATRADLEAYVAVRDELKDLCELLNEFWRAVDFMLAPNLSNTLVQERYRFVLAAFDAYEDASLERLDTAAVGLPIARRRAFSNVTQHLRALDRTIAAATKEMSYDKDAVLRIRTIWIHLSSFVSALETYDQTLAILFKDRKKAQLDPRNPAALIRPFIDEHTRD